MKLESTVLILSPSITMEMHSQHDNNPTISMKMDVKEDENATERMDIAEVHDKSRAEAVTMSSFAHLDEKNLLRKMDIRVIPMLTLLYLLSYLDRK